MIRNWLIGNDDDLDEGPSRTVWDMMLRTAGGRHLKNWGLALHKQKSLWLVLTTAS